MLRLTPEGPWKILSVLRFLGWKRGMRHVQFAKGLKNWFGLGWGVEFVNLHSTCPGSVLTRRITQVRRINKGVFSKELVCKVPCMYIVSSQCAKLISWTQA